MIIVPSVGSARRQPGVAECWNAVTASNLRSHCVNAGIELSANKLGVRAQWVANPRGTLLRFRKRGMAA